MQEGTELFKGQNYRAAGARYSKALTHAAKMFDLNVEEKEEVAAVQLSLYLNLAQVQKQAPHNTKYKDKAIFHYKPEKTVLNNILCQTTGFDTFFEIPFAVCKIESCM